MVMQFRRDPKASQEAAVSWAVVALVAHFGSQTGRFVGRMSCATDAGAAVAAGIAVANGKIVVALVAALAGDYIVHMPGDVAGRMVGTSEMACSIAHLTEHGREISAKQDSSRSLIVAARTVRVAEGQVTEVVRQNNHSDIPQVVQMSLGVVTMLDCGHSEVYDVRFVGVHPVRVAKAGHLMHNAVKRLLLYSPRLVSGVLVEACSRLASRQASSHPGVVWEAAVVAPHPYH
jgi:hypothetical protein